MKNFSNLFAGVAIPFCLAFLVGPAESKEPSVTFSSHIAPIVYQKCSGCHRPGQSGPFSLLTYDHVSERADTIKAVIEDGYMPPWKNMSPDVSFQHDRRLTKEEVQYIRRWVESGAPHGDQKLTPPLPDFPTDWQLGRPDLTVEMNGQFPVPASGPDVYRSFVFQLNLPEDKWIKAVEIKSQARSTLHHALFFVDVARAARDEDGRDGKAGVSGMKFLGRGAFSGGGRASSGRSSVSLGGYVPGTTPMLLPGDNAMLLPKGADIVMQTHFHPSGKRETEHATLALYFADRPPSRQLTTVMLPPVFGRFANIDIPAGKKNYTLTDSFTLPVDANAITVSGHAHYLGREMHLDAKLPDGRDLSLLQIHDWDLDWQDTYQFARSVPLPAGTVLRAKVVYDNSEDNPSNPHSPPQRVTWGRESYDEMGNTTLQIVAKHADDQAKLNDAIRQHVRAAAAGAARKGQMLGSRSGKGRTLIETLDSNRDGRIQRAELKGLFPRGEQVFDRLDTNRDGELDTKEQEAARNNMNLDRIRSLLGGQR